MVLFPQILYGLPIPKLVFENNPIDSGNQSLQNSNESAKTINENKTVLVNTFFSYEYEIEIESVIHNWIAEQKYLEVNASLISISSHTNIPVHHHLSYYFNSILKVKYTDWRNILRIEYAKAKIDSGSNKTITLEALSLESGFSSQSTF